MKKKVVTALLMGLMSVSLCACEDAAGTTEPNAENILGLESTQETENTEEVENTGEAEDEESQGLLFDIAQEDTTADDESSEEEDSTGNSTDGAQDGIPAEDWNVEKADDDSVQPGPPADDMENAEFSAQGGGRTAAGGDTNADDENVADIEQMKGEFSGWADDHTVEINVNGSPMGFSVEDESIKAYLSSIADGTVLSFEVEKDGGIQEIIKVR
ncbi:MAG: hypothetical protein ACI4HI_00150 [Lachnospiraceae bacterium]